MTAPPAAHLLAFDTSTDLLSIAVHGPQGSYTHEGPGGALASAQLIPLALALLAQAGCRLSELSAIAFGCGPGAFTGLRTACSVAQGLALGAGKPVIPINSLLIVAEDTRAQLCREGQSSSQPLDLWVAMDARMDEVYAQACHWDGTAWQTLSPATNPAPGALLCKPEALRARWEALPPTVVAGSALSVFAERLGLPASTRQVPVSHSRAHALLRLAQAQWARGEAVDAALALPVYVRDKVAQTTAERDALQAAKYNAQHEAQREAQHEAQRPAA